MWLLLDSVKQQIEKAMSSGMRFSAEERSELEAKSEDNGKMTLAGKSAVIPIEGILTEKFNFFAALFGGGNTTYPSIISAIEQANADGNVKDIVLSINSPGGSIDGLFSAMDAIKTSEKSVRTIIQGRALSAAYGLASQTDWIEVLNKASMVGSIGVAQDSIVLDEEVNLANTESPKKRPDLKTEEGQAIIRDQLDDIHALFAESIAIGRETTTKKVNSNYGQGAIVLAKEALEKGMIDEIRYIDADKPKRTANGGTNTEVRSMDLAKLKTDHPAVYAEAVEIGKKKERDRVNAHLKMGTASGDMATASKAIEEGTEMNQTLMATYQAAHMNKTAVEDRVEDNPDLDTPPNPEPKAEDELDKKIVAAMEGEHNQVGIWLGEEEAN